MISTGQLERNSVIQDDFNKTIYFRDIRAILTQYTTIDNIFVFVIASSLLVRQVYATTKQKIDYTTIYCRLLYCSYDRVVIVTKEIEIIYSESDYLGFNCDTCHAAKEQQQISREKIVPA